MDGGSGNVVVVTGRGYMNKRKETEIPFQKCFHHSSRNFLMQADTVLPSTGSSDEISPFGFCIIVFK